MFEVNGMHEVDEMFMVLVRLDLDDSVSGATCFADYATRWGWAVWDSHDSALDDELMDLTEEELQIMSFYTPGYRRWYSDKIDDLILGDE